MSLAVFIAVTHLLGAGHLTRAAAIGRALAGAGHRVTLASGGMPAGLISTEGLAFVQLPPVRAAPEGFGALVDATGSPVDDAYRASRVSALLDAFRAARPDVLVTELYPFGRRILAGEFGALLAAAERARPRPVVACSLRDILVAPLKPGRADEAHRIVRQHYDLVLVHGDPALVRLEASWPLAPDLGGRCAYTGYVDHDPAPVAAPEPHGAIVVSGGSSDAALPLYRAALAAAALGPDRRWHVLVGAGVRADAFAALQARAPINMVVERARADFRQLLAGAALFVGLAGYNTVLDLLATGVGAVLVPFERGRETEQRMRAEHLTRMGLAVLLPEADLTPASLRQAVDRALLAPRPRGHEVDRNGSAASVRILEAAARDRHPADLGPRDGAPVPGARARLSDRSAAPSAPALPQARLSPGLRSRVTRSLDEAADAGRSLSLWWRDDDAVRHTPALDRLLALADGFGLPIAIAAIPQQVETSLVARLADAPGAIVLVHGAHHADYAVPPDKRAEFGAHRPLATMRDELARSLLRTASLFAAQARPVLVPPWNRIAPEVVASLPALGYTGLSTFGAPCAPPGGLTVRNTNFDPVDWRRGGLGDEAALEQMWRRASEPHAGALGLLTHHLVMGDALWGFTEELLALICRHPAGVVADLATFWPSASTPGSSTSSVGAPIT